MKLALEAPAPRTLAMAGRDERFPVNRVFCVGRNYAAHAGEMGKDPDREPPFFFMKPAGAVVDAAQPARVPYPTKTKNYHHEIELVVAIGHPSAAAISLTVNGQPRQSSDIAKLIWSVSECVACLSEYEAPEPGDLIMTGTPEGVNAVVAGDVMVGEVQGLGLIEVRVTGDKT